jgi:hypothetical protein
MLKRHAIQVLRADGHQQSEIATLTDVSVRSVRRVEAEPDVSHVDDAGERDRRGIGRPSLAEPFRARVVALLTEDPALLSVDSAINTINRCWWMGQLATMRSSERFTPRGPSLPSQRRCVPIATDDSALTRHHRGLLAFSRSSAIPSGPPPTRPRASRLGVSHVHNPFRSQ